MKNKYFFFSILLSTVIIFPVLGIAYRPPPDPPPDPPPPPNPPSYVTSLTIVDFWPGTPCGTIVSGSISDTYTNNGVFLKIESYEAGDWDPTPRWMCEIEFYFTPGYYNILVFDWKVTGAVGFLSLSFATLMVYYTSGNSQRIPADLLNPTISEGYHNFNLDNTRKLSYISFYYESWWDYSVVNQYFDQIKAVY